MSFKKGWMWMANEQSSSSRVLFSKAEALEYVWRMPVLFFQIKNRTEQNKTKSEERELSYDRFS